MFFYLFGDGKKILDTETFSCNIDGNLASDWEKWKNSL